MKKSLLVRLAIVILTSLTLSGCSWSIGGGERNHDQGAQGAQGAPGAPGAQGAEGAQGAPGAPGK